MIRKASAECRAADWQRVVPDVLTHPHAPLGRFLDDGDARCCGLPERFRNDQADQVAANQLTTRFPPDRRLWSSEWLDGVSDPPLYDRYNGSLVQQLLGYFPIHRNPDLDRFVPSNELTVLWCEFNYRWKIEPRLVDD